MEPVILYTSCQYGPSHSSGGNSDSRVGSITWQSWTAESALGTGLYQGQGDYYEVQVELSTPEQTGSGLLFTSLTIYCMSTDASDGSGCSPAGNGSSVPANYTIPMPSSS